MKLKDFFSFTVCAINFVFVNPLQAENSDYGYLDITNGYRNDSIFNLIEAFDPEDVSIGVDSLKADQMAMYQFGLEGKWVFCDWLIRLEGDYAWGNSGRYHEVFTPALGLETVSNASIHKVRAKDFLCGTGYLIPFCDNFSLGPTGGWSYHQQQFKLKDARRNGAEFPLLDGLSFTNRWQGPWLGVEAAWSFCYFSLDFGYEYHWAQYHAEWTLDGPDAGGTFSDRRKSNNGYGQVGHIMGRYNFCPWWNAGIGLQYQDWKATDGRERPQNDFAGFSDTRIDKLKKVSWRTYSITFDIGYEF